MCRSHRVHRSHHMYRLHHMHRSHRIHACIDRIACIDHIICIDRIAYMHRSHRMYKWSYEQLPMVHVQCIMNTVEKPPESLRPNSYSTTRYDCRVTSQHILYYCTYYSVSLTCTVHCTIDIDTWYVLYMLPVS